MLMVGVVVVDSVELMPSSRCESPFIPQTLRTKLKKASIIGRSPDLAFGNESKPRYSYALTRVCVRRSTPASCDAHAPFHFPRLTHLGAYGTRNRRAIHRPGKQHFQFSHLLLLLLTHAESAWCGHIPNAYVRISVLSIQIVANDREPVFPSSSSSFDLRAIKSFSGPLLLLLLLLLLPPPALMPMTLGWIWSIMRRSMRDRSLGA